MSHYLIPEQLDRKSPQPIYTQIYEQLKRELVLENFHEGERFYSYRKLREIYKTELRTIASAVELLIKDGLVEMRSNSGIYVLRQTKLSGVGNVWYAVLTDQCYHPFYFNVLIGLVNEAEKYGLRVVVRFGKDREEFLRWFVPRPGEGLIVSGEIDNDLLKAAGEKCNQNIIVVGNNEFSEMVGHVVTDCRDRIRESLQRAVESGCRRIGLIMGSKRFLISQTLEQIVRECSERNGLLWTSVDEPEERGYSAMQKLSGFNPDCILMTEPAFSGAWEYMVERSIRCPEDIFLIRYGKEQNDHSFTGRSTIDLVCNSIIHGETAIRMLLKNNKDTAKVGISLVDNRKVT